MNHNYNIAGIGEILWDMFPDGERLGGAPTNFAVHCNQLGGNASPVSCVGKDELGKKTIESLNQLGVSIKHIQVSDAHATGRVQVTLDQFGKPSYNILEDKAWDQLQFTAEIKTLAQSLDAVCFGSLSQRSAVTRDTIRKFLNEMPATALKIYDVNLRTPFYSQELVEDSLGLANILKLSDEELPILASYFDLTGNNTEQLASLRDKFNLYLIAYTRGADGSILIGETQIVETAGVKTKAVDSVGAGDSFTAALCTGLLRGWTLEEVSAFANKVAAFVCSQKGATPKLPAELTQTKITS